ncbi:hypothetical protein WG66_014987 [Moniliophthora roreri]|nr:hypothetical protein WG66_014987 [Moniliophthora roreri]
MRTDPIRSLAHDRHLAVLFVSRSSGSHELEELQGLSLVNTWSIDVKVLYQDYLPKGPRD